MCLVVDYICDLEGIGWLDVSSFAHAVLECFCGAVSLIWFPIGWETGLVETGEEGDLVDVTDDVVEGIIEGAVACPWCWGGRTCRFTQG